MTDLSAYVWGSLGGVAGFISLLFMPAVGLVPRAENVLVGIFGAFVGGHLGGSMLAKGSSALGASTLGFALLGAIVMLVLLGLMRRAVGPMRPHKLPRKTRL